MIRRQFALRGRSDRSEFHITLDGWIAGPFGRGIEELCRAWQARGDTVLDDAYGDYALAVEDRGEGRIWLARSPVSSRPLFFRKDGNGLSTSSLAFDLTGLLPKLNLDALVDWYGALVGSAIEPMAIGVERVEPGHVYVFDANGRRRRRFWDPTAAISQPTSLEAAANRLRGALGDAVRDSMVGYQKVASLLSSGRDSSGVTAIAARQRGADGQTIDSFTASPGPDPLYRSTDCLLDEAPGAAMVAARYGNLRHHIVTPRGVRFCGLAEAMARVSSSPLGNPVSLHWWTQAQREAAEAGCDLILTGGMGNLTISDGGPQYLPDLLAAGRIVIWAHAISQAADFRGASWLNLLTVSFGGMVPRSLFTLAQKARGRWLESSVSPFLRPELAERIRANHAAQDQRPPRQSRLRGAELLAGMEVGDVSPDRMFGITMRDPTADRRVVEAALSIPPEMLVSRYDRRPVFEKAFGDLLPTEIVRSPRRAYQSMDWNVAYDTGELRQGLEKYRSHGLIGELVDLSAMDLALRRWPEGRLATLEETAMFGEGLLRGFALAAFLWVHFPESGQTGETRGPDLSLDR